MIVRIATIVFPIFAVVALGYFYGRRHQPVMTAANQMNMSVFMPALIFHVLARKEFVPEDYLVLAVGGLIVVLGSGLLAYPLARRLGYDWRTFVPPMMFSNYGNLGLPLFVFSFGETALSAAVVLFMVGNILHFTLGRYLLDHRIHPVEVVRSPMVLAAGLGFLFSGMQWQLPAALALPIEMLGQVAIPLMLFSLGVRLIDIDWRDWQIGLVGAVTAPGLGILLALVGLMVLPLPELQARELILFGALPPAVLNFLFAEQYQQEPRKVASMVIIGNLLSIIIIPIILVFVLK